MRPDWWILVRCFLRTYLVSANFNPKGRQNVGFLYSIDPALQAIHPTQKDLQRARKRYLRPFQTHPYFTPLLAGYCIFLENNHRALGNAGELQDYLDTVINTLSALGDSFFGGSLQVFWSLSLVLLLYLHQFLFAALVVIFSFSALQLFRVITFWRGWQDGLAVTRKLHQIDLMCWARRIKIMNAVLLAWLVILIFPSSSLCLLFFYALYLCVLIVLSEKRKFSREIVVVVFLLLVLALDVFF